MFKLWSETSSKAKELLRPDLGLRTWDELSDEEKTRIWYHLDFFFFNRHLKEAYSAHATDTGKYYEFFGEYSERECKKKVVLKTIRDLSEAYKAKSYAEVFLKHPTLNAACYDFLHIFLNGDESIVMEMLSMYSFSYYTFTKEDAWISENEGELEEDYLKRKTDAEFSAFDLFAHRLNDVLLQFGLRYILTRKGFVPRQEEKIIKEIYEPTLSCLSNPKWGPVSLHLSDAFSDYRNNTPQGYSNSVTNTVTAIQAFLQIAVEGELGKGEISKLIPKGQAKNLIPNDFFTEKIFANLESILAKERRETSIAHPKKQYASEKNARLLINLAMIFIQHCIEK